MKRGDINCQKLIQIDQKLQKAMKRGDMNFQIKGYKGTHELSKSMKGGDIICQKLLKMGEKLSKTAKGGHMNWQNYELKTKINRHKSAYSFLLLTYLFQPVQMLRRLEWRFAWCPSISRP